VIRLPASENAASCRLIGSGKIVANALYGGMAWQKMIAGISVGGKEAAYEEKYYGGHFIFFSFGVWMWRFSG